MKKSTYQSMIVIIFLYFVLIRVNNIFDFKQMFSDIMKINSLPYVYRENMEEGQAAVESNPLFSFYYPVSGYVVEGYIGEINTTDPYYEKYVANASYYEEVTEGSSQEEALQETISQNGGSSGGSMAGNSISGGLPSNIASGKVEVYDFNTMLGKYYTIPGITELTEEKFNLSAALEEDFTIVQDSSKPQILIFHTHSQEGFADSVEGDPSTSIVAVGEYLAKILTEEYGYNVIHDTTVYDYVDGKLDRNKAYTYAEEGVSSILEANPSIEVVLDIHRDGVNEGVHMVTDINGKSTAKIMFFNGISHTKVNGDIGYLYNPYIQDNLAMSLQMQLLGTKYYPDYLRKIYINAYRYCLHFRAKSMLIEVGAQTNTLQEELNAMEPLADMLHRLLSGEKAY